MSSPSIRPDLICGRDREPYAGKPQVRICAGARGNSVPTATIFATGGYNFRERTAALTSDSGKSRNQNADSPLNMVVSRIAKRPQVFEHLGPYSQHPPVAACCDLTERVWFTYHDLAGGYEHQGQKSHEYLITRMLYIAEITSSAIRLDSSWALTHAAMSLLRDRYEQTVRFSWLVRNPDQTEFRKYERAIFAKMNSLVRNMNAETRKYYEELIGRPLPAWVLESPSKDQRSYLDAWSTLDLRSMAAKRDAFPPIADTVLANESLAHWYESIYSQFSSVSHYDRYSIELLGLHKAPDGSLVLAAQPHWPSMLTLQNTLFDIIQCFEAAQICHKRDAAQTFEALLAEWLAVSQKITPR